tara:strand:+ start:1046 stop:2488 length:1443 start_codon:yes stop_codon:yes gene_type:complete
MALTKPRAGQLNFDVTKISDPLIVLHSGHSGSASSDVGIVVERGSDTNTALIYDESADRFAVINTTEDGTTDGNVTVASYADIQANAYYGDGSNLTGISGAFTAESDGASLTDTSTGSSAGPVITLTRNPSDNAGSDADYLGQIKFKGDNDAGQSNVFAKITGKILDASDGTEDGLIEFAVKKAGSNGIVARLRSDSLQLLNSTNLTVDGTIQGALVDADGDTKIQLEETSDDDIIRFDSAGNYVACVESTGIDIKGNYTLTLGGSLDANAQRLTNLGAPTSSSDAATKSYVDTELSGLSQNSISQNNTNVTVTDSGTGTIVATIDGSAHTTFNSSGITLATGVFSGTATSSQYADLAEKYTSDQQYEPGTVVELGGEQEVTQTKRPTSCTIAGIVSTNPGFIMNKDLENSVEVALIGRVPCKVVGPVRKGEFLVSSRTPGHAQAHKDLHGPPAGSAIGKAIESKDTDGPGVIEVLVGRM